MTTSTDTTIRIPQAAIGARPSPGDRFDEYLLQEPLGSSANALVFRAVEPRTGANVALKVFLLNEECGGLDALLNEFNAVRRLPRHPQIIYYGDFRRCRGYVYVRMPYCAYGTLRDLLRRRERLSRNDVLSILGQIAAGICFAHHHDLILGDVKPANILIAARKPPRIVLTDFSASQVYGLASPSMLQKTRRYAAPEQIDGLEAIHGWDHYGYGVTLVETAIGRPLEESEVIDSHHLPNEGLLKIRRLRALASALLSDVPAQRPSMADVWETLEHLKSKSPSNESEE